MSSFQAGCIASAKAEAHAEFVVELEKALQAIYARKSADDNYYIGGQRHPTIAKSFVAEEITALIDKYEEKPHTAIYGEDGNFIDWYSERKAAELKAENIKFFTSNLSDRLVAERCHPTPPTTRVE